MHDRTELRPLRHRRSRLIKDPLTGVPLLLYPEGVLKLNSTAERVLSLCTGKTVREICDELRIQFRAVQEDTVVTLLDRLAERNLIAWEER